MTTPELGVDLETKSVVDLKRHGVHKYAADPTTDLICAGFAADDGAVEIWLPSAPGAKSNRARI